ncbi:hypothetical protein F5Y02DRAFT_193998 [Annulohypoxylon stygium]|nr:hypothetical protein F5Y02DRAFT_193998 [Annulohypoxylon stygium]
MFHREWYFLRLLFPFIHLLSPESSPFLPYLQRRPLEKNKAPKLNRNICQLRIDPNSQHVCVCFSLNPPKTQKATQSINDEYERGENVVVMVSWKKNKCQTVSMSLSQFEKKFGG